MRRAIALGAIVWLAVVTAAMPDVARAAGDNDRWGANYFPNVALTTHEGASVRFYDDLIKGKIVAINLIYTSCKYACPLETARLAQVYRLLGDRMGRDVFFYSISIDPEHDTPAVLNEYAKKYGAGRGWVFLTGDKADVELISKKLGLYTPPAKANADGHRPFLLVGNEVTGQWMRNSAVDNPQFLARTIGDWMNSWQTPRTGGTVSAAEVPRGLALDRGQYTFASRCAACHTIGGGDHIGPDLLGVTAKREPAWLTRFIVAPDRMNAQGDPIAVALRAKYKPAQMPNLELTLADADALIDYLDRQSRAVKVTAVAPPANTPAAPARRDIDLTPIVSPYLRIQQALNADSLERVGENAKSIAAEAAKLGAAGAPIRAAASELQRPADLSGARAAFADVSDAILLYAKSMSAGLPAGVKVAYCPMAGKHWLQDGDEIRNPFHGSAMSACGRLSSLQEFKSSKGSEQNGTSASPLAYPNR